MRRNGIRALRRLPAGTLVRLPEELGRQTGYARGVGSTTVLVPGHHRLDGFDLPDLALVEVVATPSELADAYLRGDLGRVDRRWKRRRKTSGPDLAPRDEAEGTGTPPEEGEAA